MIDVKIYKDNLGATGKINIQEQVGQCLHDICVKHDPHFHPENTVVFLNGKKIAFPKFDDLGNMIDAGDEDAITRPLYSGDRLTIVQEVKDPFTIFAAVISIVSAVYAYSAVPKVKGDAGQGATNSDFAAQKNTARLYQARSDIYGKIDVFPDLITANAAKIIRAGRAQVTQFMEIGYGDYAVEELNSRMGTTLISEIINASTEFFYPDADGKTLVTNYFEHHEVAGVNKESPRFMIQSQSGNIDSYEKNADTLTLRFIFPSAIYNIKNITEGLGFKLTGTRSGLNIGGDYLINKIDFQSIKVMFATFSALVVEIKDYLSVNPNWASLPDSSSSASSVTFARSEVYDSVGPFYTPEKGQSVIIDFEYPTGLNDFVTYNVSIQRVESPGGVAIGAAQTFTVRHDGPGDGSTSFRQFSETFRPDGSDDGEFFKVSVLRTRIESDASDKPSVSYITRIAAATDPVDRVFDNAVIAKVVLTEAPGSINPDRDKFNVPATRKTISYINGVLVNTLQPSRRFADAVLHEMHAVFGVPIDEIDLDSLYAIQEDLDTRSPELGEFSFIFDDVKIPLGERIQSICDTCRVKVYNDGQWRFFREQKRSNVSCTITSRDISRDRNYTRQFKSRMPGNVNGVEVEWVNPETNKKDFVYRTFDEDGNVIAGKTLNSLRVQIPGCRSLSQAVNRAEFEMSKLRKGGYTVVDTLTSIGNTIDLGSVVLYCDVTNVDVLSGEILSGFNGAFYLSERINKLPPADYVISYTDSRGDLHGPFPITFGTSNEVFGNPSDFDFVYYANGISSQIGSRFIISRYEEQVGELMEIVRKEPNPETGDVQVTMETYRESQYDFEADLNQSVIWQPMQQGLGHTFTDVFPRVQAIDIASDGFTIFALMLDNNDAPFLSLSKTAGTSWETVSISIIGGDGAIADIAICSSTHMAVITDRGVAYVSTNGGTSFTRNQLIVTSQTVSTAFIRSDKYSLNTFYACVTPRTGTAPVFFVGDAELKKYSAGIWSDVETFDNGATDLSVSEDGQSIAIALTFRVAQSVNAGTSWVDITAVDYFAERVAIANDAAVLLISGRTGTPNVNVVKRKQGATITDLSNRTGIPENDFIIASKLARNGERLVCFTRTGFLAFSGDFGNTWTLSPQWQLSGAVGESYTAAISRAGSLIATGYTAARTSRGLWE